MCQHNWRASSWRLFKCGTLRRRPQKHYSILGLLKLCVAHFWLLLKPLKMPTARDSKMERIVLEQKEAEKRFWPRIKKTDSCWLWMGTRNPKGYGQISINDKRQVTSRVMWVLTNGQIPNNLSVLHKCDNPPCCNPSHLFLGNHRDNTMDSIRKGRFHYKPFPKRPRPTNCPNGHFYNLENTYYSKDG